jgi:hypothetical protein
MADKIALKNTYNFSVPRGSAYSGISSTIQTDINGTNRNVMFLNNHHISSTIQTDITGTNKPILLAQFDPIYPTGFY